MPKVEGVSHSVGHHLVKCHKFVGALSNCCFLYESLALCVFASKGKPSNYEETHYIRGDCSDLCSPPGVSQSVWLFKSCKPLRGICRIYNV